MAVVAASRWAIALSAFFVVRAGAGADSEFPLADQVTIHRDEWGVPHIDGPTDEAVVFGFGYAQAEDFLWQVEDSYVLATGRYAELYGPSVYSRDLTTRTNPARSSPCTATTVVGPCRPTRRVSSPLVSPSSSHSSRR